MKFDTNYFTYWNKENIINLQKEWITIFTKTFYKTEILMPMYISINMYLNEHITSRFDKFRDNLLS